MNAEQASKRTMRKPTWLYFREGRRWRGSRATAPVGSAGVVATACIEEEIASNTGSPCWRGRPHGSQLTTREGQVGLAGVADRPVRLKRAANPAGGKGPEFKADVC